MLLQSIHILSDFCVFKVQPHLEHFLMNATLNAGFYLN